MREISLFFFIYEFIYYYSYVFSAWAVNCFVLFIDFQIGRRTFCMLLEISLPELFIFLRCYLVVNSFNLTVLLWFLQEGFAFAHCTTCKAPYHLRVHVVADRKWRTLKFRFFVTRDIIFIFLAVQLVGCWSLCLFWL